MHKFIILLIISLVAKLGQTQPGLIPCSKVEVSPSILYVGVLNEVKVSALGLTGTINITVDTGELKLIGKKKYIIPATKGIVNVLLTIKDDRQASSEYFKFEAIELPNPDVLFIKSNGQTVSATNKMSCQELKNIETIDIYYNLKQAIVNGHIKSITLVGVKENGQLIQFAPKIENLKEDFNTLLKLLNKGDFIFLKDITVVFPLTNTTKSIKNVCIEIE